MRIGEVLCLFLTITSISLGNIINIPDDYATIQGGVNVANDGDTVLVQPGTYEECVIINSRELVIGSMFLLTEDTTYIYTTSIDANGAGSVVSFINCDTGLAMLKGFTLTNGIANNGGGIYCLNSNPGIIKNIIMFNCSNQRGAGIYCENSNPLIDNNFVSRNDGSGIYCYQNSSPSINNNIFSYNSGGGIRCRENSNPVISYNTIAENSTGYAGAGIYSVQCELIIENNIIRHNTTFDNGGGIYCLEGAASVINNVIENNNSALLGGGIYCYGDSSAIIGKNIINNNVGGGVRCYNCPETRIYNNTISGNRTYSTGGGIHCESSNPTISGNFISDNRVFYNFNYNCGGAGIYCQDSDPTIINNVIVRNAASDSIYGYGGGVYCLVSNPVIRNNTICLNSAATQGGGILCESASPIITNNIIRDNIAAHNSSEIYFFNSNVEISYCNIQDGFPGEGNIDIDPLLRDPENGDYHLMATYCGDSHDSPCIDMGHPDFLDSLIDCDWGLGAVRSDMGAYSGGDSTEVSINNLINLPENIKSLHSYPNPFNAQTTISFSLETQSLVNISIYDITGRLVDVLTSRTYQAGKHYLAWDAADQPSGIYFARLSAGEAIKTNRMVLIK